MAVLSVKLLWTGKNGKDTFDKHRTYRQTFEVITNDAADNEQTVGNATGIPTLGSSYVTDPNAIVVGIDCNLSDESPLIWHVTVDYDSKPDLKSSVDPNGNKFDPSSVQQNPLDRLAEWSITSQDSTEVVTEWRVVTDSGAVVFTNPDAWAGQTKYTRGEFVQNGGNVYRAATTGASGFSGSGSAPTGTGFNIVDGGVTWNFWGTVAQTVADPQYAIPDSCTNSGNVPFDPPPMVEVSKPVIVVTKNMPVVSLEYVMAMKNAVNATTWRTCPPRTAKCLTVEANSKYENGVSYVEVKWHIALDPETWDARVLDCGWGAFEQFQTVDGELEFAFVEFKDVNGESYTAAVPMDGLGKKLAPDESPVFLRGVPRQQRIVDFNLPVLGIQLPF